MMQGQLSRRTRQGVALSAAGLLVAGLGVGAGAVTAQAASNGNAGKSDVRHVGGDYNDGKPLPLSKQGSRAGGSGVKSDEFQVGTVRQWPALDDAKGVVYSKQFVLRGIGDNVEVWVAKDLAFPAGSDGVCRNTVGGGEGIVVTDEQVASFIDEFDSNIYPLESDVFSTPPSHDGSVTPLTRAYAQFYGLPARNFKGDGDRIVTLVDNVRDSNYYTPRAEDGRTYIAGFFWSLINNYTNRNVMTLDSWDWIHRTGTNPPDDSQDPDYLACSEQILRPFGDPRPLTYEGTFAHEYQHLLEYYASPGESSWVNEGLSDWAQTLVGYVDPSLSPDSDDPDVDGHMQAWMGFADDEDFGGPEQSLTRWEDQGAPEILADYGMAYAFMEYLWSHFGGNDFMTALHNQDLNGFAGLDATLEEFEIDASSLDVIHDFLASVAVDQELEGGKTLVNGDAGALSTDSLSAKINWSTPQANDSPGAPTNGADYVGLGGGGQVTFDGSETYPTTPTTWTETADGRLFSGAGDNLDSSIAREITVPAGNPTVTVDLEYDTEPAWDFAFVQVWDDEANEGDGGWVSLANENTTDQADPDADPLVVANLPGFTGSSGGVTAQTFDLGDYAGQNVWLAVRYITDGAVTNPGVWLSGLSVGGAEVPDATELDSWSSLSEAKPTAVESWTVQLVGWNDGQVSVVTVPLDGDNAWSGDTAAVLGITPTFVGAIVTANDSTEQMGDYPTYELTLGGALQPGGGTES
jgi:hypothetical protein